MSPEKVHPAFPLGRALVSEGIINQNQLRYALQVQQESVTWKRIGDILLDLGYVTKRELREVARKYNHKLQIGTVLVESGAITEQQLSEALAAQKSSRLPLCEILVSSGVLSEERVAEAMSRQLDFPYIIPNKRLIDRNLLRLIPKPMMKQHNIVPLSRDKDIVTVLMQDPLDQAATGVLDQVLGGKYEIAVAPKSQIARVVSEILDEQQLLQQVSASSETDASTTSLRRYDLQKYRPDTGPESQVVNIVDFVLSNAIGQRASDIHIESMYNRLRVRHRVDGKLLFETDLPVHLAERIVRRIKVLAGINVADASEAQDGHIYVSLENNNIDLRVSLFPSVLGVSITIRALTREIGLKDLGDLGVLPRVHMTLKQILDSPAGMIIFAGPTGVGKTTSMYSCLNYLNSGEYKICTIESPVEFSIEGISQCQVKNTDEKQMGDKIRAMMRQDPDVIVLGEVNDEPTAQTVIQAALTGHKVMTTIHADDSFSAIMRLMEMGLRTYLLSSTGLTSISQRLVRKICASCREPYTPPRNLFRQFRLKGIDPDTLEFFHGRGCDRCGGIGFVARTGVFEMLAMDPEIRNGLLEHQNLAVARKIAEQTRNYISLREAGYIMALKGETNLEEILGILSYAEQKTFSEMNLTQSAIQYWLGTDEEE